MLASLIISETMLALHFFLHGRGRERKRLMRFKGQECILIPGSLTCATVLSLEESLDVMFPCLKITHSHRERVKHKPLLTGLNVRCFADRKARRNRLSVLHATYVPLVGEVGKSLVFVQRLTVHVHASLCREFRDTAITCCGHCQHPVLNTS